MNKETFKDILNYEGLYQVSNFGNVKSIKRYAPFKNSQRIVSEKNLKQGLDQGGYLFVNLCKNSERKTWRIHQLVAIAFLNHKPNGLKLVIDHINNIKSDNRVENLQIITQRENASKDRKNGSSKYTGVYWIKRRNKWGALIFINGKRKYLGSFTHEYDAYLAYKKEFNYSEFKLLF